jgi:hypothetical protein
MFSTDGVRHFIALLALCSLLVVTTASELPGHAHDNDNARPCDICHSGHLPCLQPAGEIRFSAHLRVVWQQTPENLECRQVATSVVHSPRAPPALDRCL